MNQLLIQVGGVIRSFMTPADFEAIDAKKAELREDRAADRAASEAEE